MEGGGGGEGGSGVKSPKALSSSFRSPIAASFRALFWSQFKGYFTFTDG